jgi:hypothetical protein
MSAAAGLHSDQESREIHKKYGHLFSLDLLFQHNLSMLIYCVDLEYGFCQIDANGRNLHDDAPLGSSGCPKLPLWHIDAATGGGVHPIALSAALYEIDERLKGVQQILGRTGCATA